MVQQTAQAGPFVRALERLAERHPYIRDEAFFPAELAKAREHDYRLSAMPFLGCPTGCVSGSTDCHDGAFGADMVLHRTHNLYKCADAAEPWSVYIEVDERVTPDDEVIRDEPKLTVISQDYLTLTANSAYRLGTALLHAADRLNEITSGAR